VRTDGFAPGQRRQSDPGMGTRTYWTVRAGGQVAQDAAYSWQQPPPSAGAIAGLIAFDWDSFTVFEEDEQVSVHPRDPYTRIDVLRSSRSVRVTVDDVVVAASIRPRMLLESGLPVRCQHAHPAARVPSGLPAGAVVSGRCRAGAGMWGCR
jgi:uncharacterized protein (DUF427 family)